jgi:hypothetical protein
LPKAPPLIEELPEGRQGRLFHGLLFVGLDEHQLRSFVLQAGDLNRDANRESAVQNGVQHALLALVQQLEDALDVGLDEAGLAGDVLEANCPGCASTGSCGSGPGRETRRRAMFSTRLAINPSVFEICRTSAGISVWPSAMNASRRPWPQTRSNADLPSGRACHFGDGDGALWPCSAMLWTI